MNWNYENTIGSRIPVALIIITTFLSVAVSLLSLSSGYYIIFQNLFYIPIILACIFYLRRGLLFSVLLSLLYFSLLMTFAGFGELESGIIRTALFITIASLVTVLAERTNDAEIRIREKNNELDAANTKLKKKQ
ncbi:MAG: hypothetical protein JXQ82_05380 [Methanomicrobiaceae archaeon]|nr:hypothetical protein [Methanomicrobiaceae archaeon]